jgi:ribonuclease P protein subunit POP4
MNREQLATASKGQAPSRDEVRARTSIAKGELIGLRVTVAASTDPRKRGVQGVVVDETMHTLTLDTGEKVVMVAKPECSFRFESKGKAIEVRGADVDFRPEDRIKKVR